MNKNYRQVLTALLLSARYALLLFSFPLTAISSEPPGDFAAQFEQAHLLPLVAKMPGAAVVIVERGEVVLEKVYGHTEVGGKAPITHRTLFRLASLSKTFASAAASILVQDTPLTWQSPLQPTLAHLSFKDARYGKDINLLHLMSHSTGLMPHAYTNLIEEDLPYRRIIARLNRVDFICAPGNCYSYQNVAFSLVGDLVEATTGMDYPAFVEARIFRPLGMQRASFGLDAYTGDKDHAKPHVWTGKQWIATRPSRDYYKVAPAAGVNASISDMRVWLLAQMGLNPDVLQKDMLAAMHEGVIRTSRRQAHYPRQRKLGKVYYGLGWRVFDYGGEPGFVQHGGYVQGMCSQMVFNRHTRTGMVFLTNSEPPGMNELVFDFLEMRGKSDEKTVMNSEPDALSESVPAG